jgi:hypothetical protein
MAIQHVSKLSNEEIGDVLAESGKLAPAPTVSPSTSFENLDETHSTASFSAGK